MQVWNVLHAARWKYRTQKIAKNNRHGHHRTILLDYIFATKARIDNRKNLLNSNISPTCLYNIVDFGPLATETVSLVWGTPADVNGFRVLASLLHGTVVGVGQTLRRWTEGATYIRQGGHHVGHWPTFRVVYFELGEFRFGCWGRLYFAPNAYLPCYATESFSCLFCVAVFLCSGRMFALGNVRFSFFSATPRDRLGRTSPKWPWCCVSRVGRKSLTQSQSAVVVNASINSRSQMNVDVKPKPTVHLFSSHLPEPCTRHDSQLLPHAVHAPPDVIMAALCNRGGGHYIFALWFLSILYRLSSIFFSSPNLSGHRLDLYHTSTHGMALVRI